MAWTRITDPEEAARVLPAWFSSRMIGLRGRFGLMLTTGDVMKITSVTALHQSSAGAVLLDVLLDQAGVPDGIDLAWRPKHYLGAPVPAATVATVNLAHVIAAIEFVVEEIAESPHDASVPLEDDANPEASLSGSLLETIARAEKVGTV